MSVHQITVDDPGSGRRLGQTQIGALRASLADARNAPTVLLIVEDDAWADAGATDGPATVRQLSRVVETIYGMNVPVVCHVSGHVTGAGLALALACDLRYAGPASQWGVGDPASAAGLGTGISWLLRDRIGSALHDHLSWTGALLPAEEAKAGHLVSDVGGTEIAAARTAHLATLTPRMLSAIKRSSRGGSAPMLSERLEYDGWLRRAVEETLKF